MSVKAKLKIQLFANDVVVAESADENLWSRVLAAIQGSGEVPKRDGDGLSDDQPSSVGSNGRSKGLEGFAKELGVTRDELVGACDPRAESPYIHLDPKCWESFKKNTPPRGAAAVSATQLAGTFLCLWFKYRGIDGLPTQAMAIEVFNALGASDKNTSRSIKNCAWLQSRGGGIQLNPAEISKAHAVAKAFVVKEKI